MVVIRLARGGAKKKPFYRVVVADQRFKRDGRFIEQIGYYDPLRANHTQIDVERVEHWVGKGAQMSNRVSRVVNTWKDGGFEAGAQEKALETKLAANMAKAQAKADAAAKAAAAEAAENAVETADDAAEAEG